MIIYLLHASLLIGLLYGFYRLLLSGETFFGFHRWILLGGIALAFVLPLISIPSTYSLRDMIINEEKTDYIIASTDVMLEKPAMTDVGAIANDPLQKTNIGIIQSEFEATETKAISTEVLPIVEQEKFSISSYISTISIGQIVIAIYGLGIVCLLLYLCFQLFLLAKFRRRGEVTSSGRYTIVEHDDCDQSFSFGRVIYLHKSADQVLDRDHIIRHEMIHARQLHSVDIIIGELLTIVLWFNPFAWMYKKAMRDNLEYLTDRQMLDEGADTKAYQLSLVRITVPHTLSQMRQPSAAVALANNYNHSTLKQRIIMMNKKYSSYAKVWRHLMILPVIGITMAVCNNVIAEQAPEAGNSIASEALLDLQYQEESKKETVEKTIQKQKELQKESSKANTKAVTRAQVNNSEIDVNIEAQVNQAIESSFNVTEGLISNVVATTVSNVVPATISAVLDETLNSEDFMAIQEEQFGNVPISKDGEVTGRWEIEDDCIHFWMRGKNYFSNWSECDFDLSGFTQSTFTIRRDAGTLTLTESVGNDFREGRFAFETNESFQSFLESRGITGIRDREMMHLFNTDINKDYINFLDKKGYDVSKSNIIALAVHNVDDDEIADKITALESRDFRTDDLSDIITMSIHNVDGEYMDEIDDLGFSHRRIDDYVSMRIHDVDKDLVMSLKRAGYADLTADEIVSMAIHDVDEDFINDLAKAGYRNLDVKKIVSMAIHDVDPRFIQEVRDMGFDNLDLDDMIGFAIHDVDQEYIEALKEAGIDDLDAQEITSFAIHDVNPALINLLNQGGFGRISNQDILSAAIHDVDERFLRDIEKAGMTDLDFDDIVSFATHDVDSDYIEALSELGLTDLSPKDLINGKIHGVRPEFIEEITELGFDDVEMDDLIDLRIHNIDAQDIQRMKEKDGEIRDLKDYSRKIRRRNW